MVLDAGSHWCPHGYPSRNLRYRVKQKVIFGGVFWARIKPKVVFGGPLNRRFLGPLGETFLGPLGLFFLENGAHWIGCF